MKTGILIFAFIFFASGYILSQERGILKPDGEIINIPISKSIEEAVQQTNKSTAHIFHGINESALSTLDTLYYWKKRGDLWNTDFGFFGQDAMLTWFKAPADLIIKAAGFSCSDDSGAKNGADVGIRLIKLNCSAELLASISTTYMGYYPSQGDGYNNADYFGENATGDWIDSTGGKYPLPPWAHEDYDLWSNDKKGFSVVPKLQNNYTTYQWVEMNQLGNEPQVKRGEVFAIVIEHYGKRMGEDRFGIFADNTISVPSWKYYENGRNNDGKSPGWWIRKYTFDMAVFVDLTGNNPPAIQNIGSAPVTYLNNPLTVYADIVDDNFSGGPVGVEEAFLNVLLTETDTLTFQMIKTDNEGNEWRATIPDLTVHFDRTTKFHYYIEAIDVTGNFTKSKLQTASVFFPSKNAKTLFVIGLKDELTNDLAQLYQTPVVYDKCDFWSYGYSEPDLEVLENYQFVFFSSVNYSLVNYSSLWNCKLWLDKNSNSVLAIMGDEWIAELLSCYGDNIFQPGELPYDLLGLTQIYIEIGYSPSGMEFIPPVMPIQYSLLGGELYEAVKNSGADTLYYNPTLIFGNPIYNDAYKNHDGEVFFKAIGIDSSVYICGHNRIYGNNNHVVVMTFDPLSLIDNKGYWWGNTDLTPLHQVQTKIIDKILSAEESSSIPEKFSLSQNYPNPFNPSTTIKYSIPIVETGHAPSLQVRIIAFDILGQEIRTLVNGEHKPGNYTVEFNADGLS
ncbi:MAG: hypothetical protein KJ799_00765, partial [Bacteroidetes bacterium]|nr:hypothetical protein [Bacteroidota bacterium]